MTEPVWFNDDSLHQIQRELIEDYGGSHGVRDEDAIQAALARPRQKYHYGSEITLARLAAAYCFGLAKAHGFVDGNKRIGTMVMIVFLETNGHELSADLDEMISVVERVASSELTEEQLAQWIASHIQPSS
jgi:death-on-curing protein